MVSERSAPIERAAAHRPPGDSPTVAVPGAVPYGDPVAPQKVEDVGAGDAWWTQVTKGRITPNPDHEQVIITADPGGGMVDQLIVDTICVQPQQGPPLLKILSEDNGECHLTWSPAGNYILQFDTSPDFNSPVSIAVSGSSTIYTAGISNKGFFQLVQP